MWFHLFLLFLFPFSSVLVPICRRLGQWSLCSCRTPYSLGTKLCFYYVFYIFLYNWKLSPNIIISFLNWRTFIKLLRGVNRLKVLRRRNRVLRRPRSRHYSFLRRWPANLAQYLGNSCSFITYRQLPFLTAFNLSLSSILSWSFFE